MDPIAIISVIMAAVSAAPKVKELAIAAKDFLVSLFNAGLISAEQQNAAMAHVDSICALSEAGIVPPAWQVEPD